MAEEGPAEPTAGATGSFSSKKQRKGFISPSSSFIDFGNIENEYFTDELRMTAAAYNPHKDRVMKKPASDFTVVVHMMKGSVGAGLLAMPMAFSHVGVVSGTILTIILSALCVYSMHTLIRMQYIQCQILHVPFIPLPISMRIAFKNGPHCLRCLAYISPILVDLFLILYQLGICVAYEVFIASSIKQAIEPDIVENWDLKIYILLIFIPVCLVNFIRDLKRLMPLSLVANILVIISLLACLYYIFFVGEWKTDTTKSVVPVSTWPLFMGTILFALEAIGVVIALEHNMKHPGHFLGVKGLFPWCLSVVGALYLVFGLLGYLKYGTDIKETIFASLPKDEWLSKTVYGIYGICIFLTHPLQCFVSLEILWGNYIRHVVHDPMKECFFEYVLRIFAVVITFIVALLIPQIDIIISLIGALCISVLGIICPFFLELCTRYPDDLGCCKWVVLKDIILIIVGILILVLGTYVSLYSYIVS